MHPITQAIRGAAKENCSFIGHLLPIDWDAPIDNANTPENEPVHGTAFVGAPTAGDGLMQILATYLRHADNEMSILFAGLRPKSFYGWADS